MGSDLFQRPTIAGIGEFQSTLPYGERRRTVERINQKMKFQSTLPYGERRISFAIKALRACFNPRSRMGSDRLSLSNLLQTAFQSTLPYGERPYRSHPCHLPSCVSIHAPVWGATISGRYPFSFCSGFNPRSRMGSDKQNLIAWKKSEEFQSTLPYGERQQSRTIFLPFSVIVYAIITILLY